jgi:hypothetical protein
MCRKPFEHLHNFLNLNHKTFIMKKSFIVIFITVSLIVFTLMACKKDASVPYPVSSEQPSKKLVEYRNLTNPSDWRTYSYNSQGMLTAVESGTHSWTFNYSPGKITVIARYKNNGAHLSTMEHTLDAMGRTSSAVSKDPSGIPRYTQQVTYNQDGYMTYIKNTWDNGEINESFYTVSEGNVIKEEYKVNGILEDRSDYEYETTVKTKLYESMMSSWGVKDLYGKGHTNEIKGFKRYDNAGVLTFQKTSSFTWDNEGYVTQRTDYFPISNQTYKYEYLYQ